MATAKEIKAQIGSINNTKKITRAFEMIAASKMRKARDRMDSGRPYAKRMREVISHVAGAHAEFTHPYMSKRKVKKIGLIVISTDRGLCGGLNINLFKQALKEFKKAQKHNIEIELAIIGKKAEDFFKRIGATIVSYAHHLGEAPKVSDIIGSVEIMLQNYKEAKIDELYLLGNNFISTISQKPYVQQLLPILPETISRHKRTEEAGSQTSEAYWDYIYEPDAKTLLTKLLERYIESQVYHGVVENVASEQAARMIAMKNASENAGELIDDLALEYNKARQAAITKELAEIVSGSDAV